MSRSSDTTMPERRWLVQSLSDAGWHTVGEHTRFWPAWRQYASFAHVDAARIVRVRGQRQTVIHPVDDGRMF